MKNLQPALKPYEVNKEYLQPGYQHIKCHMISDVKLGDNFRIKAGLVVGGHMTTAPSSVAFSSIVSRDSVRIALNIVALNGLYIFPVIYRTHI